MSKDQYYKRFESLFSSPDAVAAEPPNGRVAEAEASAAALQSRLAEMAAALATANAARLKADRELQLAQAALAAEPPRTEAAEADLSRRRHPGFPDSLCRPEGCDRNGPARGRRLRQGSILRQRLHDLWLGQRGSRDDVDSPGRPRISRGDLGADREVLPRPSVEAVTVAHRTMQ